MPETTTPSIAANDLAFLRRLQRVRNDFKGRALSPIVDSLAPTASEIEAALKAEKGRAARAVERERLQARLAELDGDAPPAAPAPEPTEPPSLVPKIIRTAYPHPDDPGADSDPHAGELPADPGIDPGTPPGPKDGRKSPARKGAIHG